ncbi:MULTISPECIES: hypothetical protein [unclassified Brenneria]|uniref:hypothetical protein n=1 Tax=unclassified Brenneria TaxID=2634434 RepID=UPI0029C37F67|nr:MULTISPECIES: hypothetical protein [unclassified Brenneria]MDX5628023.1 hypothetical protein [Brenneria sp. L3-3Z]MDX5694957.1 hypothetical protein [Brenneria sp. L4-2C]
MKNSAIPNNRIQRRIDCGRRGACGGKAPQEVIRATIGNVSDFANIGQARETARNFNARMAQEAPSGDSLSTTTGRGNALQHLPFAYPACFALFLCIIVDFLR